MLSNYSWAIVLLFAESEVGHQGYDLTAAGIFGPVQLMDGWIEISAVIFGASVACKLYVTGLDTRHC